LTKDNHTLLISGKPFWLDGSRTNLVGVEEIATAISNLCRFSGNLPAFYSVAEHSVYVSLLLDGTVGQTLGLLHDAAESVISEIPFPVKNRVPQLQDMEDRYLDEILSSLLTDYKTSEKYRMYDWSEVWRADRAVLVWEMLSFFGKHNPWATSWIAENEVDSALEEVSAAVSCDSPLCLSPREAKRLFLFRYRQVLGVQ